MAAEAKGLGRREPQDFNHVEKYPFSSVAPVAAETVERTLKLPSWHRNHDQGREGSCVGHAAAMERAITNTAQNRVVKLIKPSRRYDPLHLWNEAKLIDEWSDTNPGDDNGTSVRAAYDVLRTQGARRIKGTGMALDPVTGRPTVVDKNVGAPDPADGVETNRWAVSTDEIRSAIAKGLPVTIGVNWYSNFYSPVRFGNDWWIGRGGELGRVRGGHALTVYGASDRRQAVKLKNSWGKEYPLVYLPYEAMQRLLNEYGESALVTDR